MAESEHNVTFDSAGTTAHGYLEKPVTGSGPGVIVIQEWWGLTTHIASLVRRLADEGFVALAPDLYGNRTTHDADEAMAMMQDMDEQTASALLAGSVDHLLSLEETTSSTVGVIGFCMGGGFVLSLAGEAGDKVSAAVPFYGLPSDGLDAGRITADVQGHYGRQDEMVTPDAVEGAFEHLKERSGATTELHFYDAGHAFVNDENLIGTYDPENAQVAWDRAVSFLRERLRP